MRPFYRGNGHQDALGNLKTSRISQCALGGGAYSMLAPQALVELAVGSSQARAYLWSDDNHGCLKKNPKPQLLQKPGFGISEFFKGLWDF